MNWDALSGKIAAFMEAPEVQGEIDRFGREAWNRVMRPLQQSVEWGPPYVWSRFCDRLHAAVMEAERELAASKDVPADARAQLERVFAGARMVTMEAAHDDESERRERSGWSQ